VPVSQVEARNHEVVHRATGRRLGYGALAKDAAGQPVPAREALRLKDPDGGGLDGAKTTAAYVASVGEPFLGGLEPKPGDSHRDPREGLVIVSDRGLAWLHAT
jgi:hypothetical protein